MAASPRTGVLFIVRFKSTLSAAELERRYKERIPEYREIPGLLQKYYLHDPETDEWGGCYLWDSQASLDEFLASDLRETIASTYQFAGPPKIETIQVIEFLRPEKA